jgi:hypothetical protein
VNQQQQHINEAAQRFADVVWESYRTVAESAVAAQELNAELTQHFFNDVLDNLRAEAGSNRDLTQRLADQQQRQREVTQALTQESVDAYTDFLNSMFSLLQRRVIRSPRHVDQPPRRVAQAQSWGPSIEKSKEAIESLDEWLADESGYDEETWPELKAALERNRLSDRKLFVD